MGLVDVLEFEASGSADDLGLVDNWRYVEDLGLVEMEGLTPTPPHPPLAPSGHHPKALTSPREDIQKHFPPFPPPFSTKFTFFPHCFSPLQPRRAPMGWLCPTITATSAWGTPKSTRRRGSPRSWSRAPTAADRVSGAALPARNPRGKGSSPWGFVAVGISFFTLHGHLQAFLTLRGHLQVFFTLHGHLQAFPTMVILLGSAFSIGI